MPATLPARRLGLTEAPFSARVSYIPEPAGPPNAEVKAYAMAVINTIKELLPLNPLYVEELRMFLDRFGPEDPSHLADFAASLTTSTKTQLQEVLEATALLPRMEKVLVLLNNELELARAQQKIRHSVEERMQTQQREFMLREQLKAIQKELGLAKDDRTAELDKFKARLAKLHAERGGREAGQRGDGQDGDARDRLPGVRRHPQLSGLDHPAALGRALPGQARPQARPARPRPRPLRPGGREGPASWSSWPSASSRARSPAPSSSWSGPPGVGKTSIGRSIADALGRRFYRFSLGGMRDEAEIKGHRRTYIGAMPGKFLQAVKDAGTANPVIMLDEIDKIGASYHGDPASALLEVLDPEQNVGLPRPLPGPALRPVQGPVRLHRQPDSTASRRRCWTAWR